MTSAFVRGLRRLFGIKKKQINRLSIPNKSKKDEKIKSLEEERLSLDTQGIKEVIIGDSNSVESILNSQKKFQKTVNKKKAAKKNVKKVKSN